MRRFGLLIQDLISEYSKNIVSGVQKYCDENNIQLFIFVIRAKDSTSGIYDYQYFTSIKLATKNNLDGIILVSNALSNSISQEQQIEAIQQYSDLPVLRVSVDMCTEDQCYTAGRYFKLREEVYNVQYFLQDLQITDETEKLKAILMDHFKKFGIESCVCCIYNQPKLHNRDEDFILPDKASVFLAYNQDKVFVYDDDYSFNPAEGMYPADFSFTENKEIIVNALFDQEYQYGYLLYTPGNSNPSIYELITTITGTSLASNLVFSEKALETEKLSSETKTLETTTYFDEMTGVLNRRGLYKYALPAMKSALERGLDGSVIFGDMDHLKQINDKYGHEAGDRAINGEVEILKKVFRTQDVIARVGGDEFIIVACGLKSITYDKVLERLEETTAEYNEAHKEPFEISISMGFVQFSNNNKDLEVLIKKADEEQYKQKVLHHKNRS